MAARHDGLPRSAPVPIWDQPPIGLTAEDQALKLSAELGSAALLKRIQAYHSRHGRPEAA